MRVPLSWLKDYVDIDLTPAALADRLTFSGLEVEGIETVGSDFAGLVAAEVRAIAPHPNADKLRICRVFDGQAELSVVCGAWNFNEGAKVILAPIGAQLPNGMKIKPAKIRGEPSSGMLCAADELGLSDDHSGLLLLPPDTAPGTPAARLLGPPETVLVVEVTPNRPDCLSLIGIAREVAVLTGARLRLPEPPADPAGREIDEWIRVAVDDAEGCPRYTARAIAGVKPGPSPDWMQKRLTLAGVRPINRLVDITNWVMLAVGQPTHAFDRELVRDEIVVRTARPGETLTLLDGKRLKLTEDDLMICDRQEPIALAGVMGGVQDSILPGTSKLLLEIANFEPRGVRRSAARYQVRTESANRNEKGLDSQRVDQAMAVAHRMICELYPDAKMTGFADAYPARTEPKEIEVGRDWLATRLGRDLNFDEVKALLSPLGFDTSLEGETLRVRVPSWRSTGDVSQKDDVLEELARMIGYEHVAFIPPTVKLDAAVNQPRVTMERRVREYLAFQCALQEVYTYPWVDRAYLKAAGIQEEDCLQLAAPPSPDTACLRSSLVPAMLEVAGMNLRYLEQFGVFELAQVFSPGSTHPSDPEESLPLQRRSLAAALVGKDARALFSRMKGILEQLPRAVMSAPLAFDQQEKPAWADSKAWLNILCEGEVIGSLGLLSIGASHLADIRHAFVSLMELDMDALPPLPSRSNRYQPLPHFPQVEQDFSVLLDDQVTWAQLSQALEKTVRSLEFIEEYRGKQVPEGKKSLMFRVSFGLDDATMTNQQIEEKVSGIRKKLQKLGGELRM